MTNSQQKSFHGSHNPSDWVSSEYPSFVVDVTGDFALFMTVDGEPQKLEPGIMFFIETDTSPPFNCEGFLCAFRLKEDNIEFIGYEPSLVTHLEQQYSSSEGLRSYWGKFFEVMLKQNTRAGYDDEGNYPVVASVNNTCWTAELVKFYPPEAEKKMKV